MTISCDLPKYLVNYCGHLVHSVIGTLIGGAEEHQDQCQPLYPAPEDGPGLRRPRRSHLIAQRRKFRQEVTLQILIREVSSNLLRNDVLRILARKLRREVA